MTQPPPRPQPQLRVSGCWLLVSVLVWSFAMFLFGYCVRAAFW